MTVNSRAQVNLVLREMGRCLAGLVADRRERTDRLIQAVDPTPEQEAEIRRIIRERGPNNKKGEPTAEERAEKMRQVMKLLTPEQRKRVMDLNRPGE